VDKRFNFSLPVEFEQVGNVLDDRFMKVKIYIAHVGENRNRSVFTKEVLESMIPSLANIPILGYITVDEDGNTDFKGHEERLVIENGEFKLQYIGHAYGVVPENNNAHFEFRYGNDGVEREYLVAEGILWTGKFPEVKKIFDRDGGFKSQSMELEPSSVMGYTNDEGLFVFTQAKFEGLCILGEGVTPAMINSTIERFSVADRLKVELSEMLKEFNAHFSATQEKGDETVDKEVLETVENTEFEEQPQEDQKDASPVDNFEETPSSENTTEETPSEGEGEQSEKFEASSEVEGEGETAGEEPAKFTVTRTFELSHDDIRKQMWEKIDSHMQSKGYDGWFWINTIYETYLIVSDDDSEKFYKVGYSNDNGTINLGDVEEVFPMFLTAEEKSAIEITRANFEALENEVKQLREFKENIELKEKEAKLAQYANVLSQEEYKTIKDNLKNFSLIDIEKEIGFLLLRKNHFSANKQEETPSRVNATPSVESNPYGSLASYFYK
jgi:hypothetical protein